jgi:hypothetical protein
VGISDGPSTLHSRSAYDGRRRQLQSRGELVGSGVREGLTGRKREWRRGGEERRHGAPVEAVKNTTTFVMLGEYSWWEFPMARRLSTLAQPTTVVGEGLTGRKREWRRGGEERRHGAPVEAVKHLQKTNEIGCDCNVDRIQLLL